MHNFSHDWYFYLYGPLTDELISPDSYKRFSDNKVAFLTFNYDRSLEHFLEESLRNSFRSAHFSELTEQLNKITIHHIHGRIDNPRWLGGREYQTQYSLDDVGRLYRNIKIIHENSNVQSETQKLIKEAERIFFLGFGYAKENSRALGIGSVEYGGKRIFGTALGLSPKEHNDYGNYLKLHFRIPHADPDRTVILEQNDSVQLLKDHL